MPTWATYRGLTVPSSTTGDAGGYLKGDLTALSDRDRLIAPVKVAALSNVASLSGPQTIGGVSLVAGDRVLFTAQTTASQNGPWVVQSGAWTRPDDTPAGTGLAGALVFSQNGVSGAYAANSAWLCTNSPGSDIIGTNSLTFARITGLALATASSPLSITNDTLSLSGVVPVAFGGTGSSTALSNNRIIVSSGGTYAEAAALTSGQLLIGSTGAAPVAASLTGTTNQITVTGGAGSITLALPQNIHTAATPTFGGLTLTGAATVTSVAAASLTTSGTITATGAISSSSTITASGLGTFAGVTVSGTNVLTLPVGAAGTPSLTYTGDTDTGLFSPAAGRLAVSTDGTVALTASSGRIGIGSSATAPNAALSVGTNGISDSNVPVQINASSGGEAWYGVNKAGGYGLLVGYSGNAAVLRNAHATDPLNFVVANTTTAGYIASNGGLVWGTPTGGSKGSGTINCQNLYVNNTQLNVPDYVFDIAFDGRVREEQDLEERDVPDSPHRSELIWRGTGQPATTDELVEYRRRTGRPILSVGELDQFVRSHRHLPTLRSREERYMQGAASIADLLREQHETIEHLSLYILELHRRLSTLEQTVTAAATNN